MIQPFSKPDNIDEENRQKQSTPNQPPRHRIQMVTSEQTMSDTPLNVAFNEQPSSSKTSNDSWHSLDWDTIRQIQEQKREQPRTSKMDRASDREPALGASPVKRSRKDEDKALEQMRTCWTLSASDDLTSQMTKYYKQRDELKEARNARKSK